MDHHTINRIKRQLSDPYIGPETIALMLTRACNFKCIYCPNRKNYKMQPEFLDELCMADLLNLFEDALDFQVKEINLGGMVGEPSCRMHFLRILSRIKRMGFVGSMTTNGSFLDKEAAKILTDYGWDMLLVSLDSCNPHIQHCLRPAIDQKQYFQGIKDFLNMLNSIHSNLKIRFNMVVTKLNYKELGSMVEFANHYKNVESINILKLIDRKLDNYSQLQLNQRELDDFKAVIVSLKNEKKLAYPGDWIDPVSYCNNSSTAEKHKGNITEEKKVFRGCFANYYILSIDANGDILHCPAKEASIRGLNIKNKSLRELWPNELFEFRRQLLRDAPCLGGCCTILKEENKLISSALTEIYTQRHAITKEGREYNEDK